MTFHADDRPATTHRAATYRVRSHHERSHRERSHRERSHRERSHRERSHPAGQRSIAALALAVSAVLAQAACGAASPPADGPDRPCTMIGCLDGLHVELSPAKGWAPGAYRFAIETPEGTTTCEGSLPLPACAAGSALRCAGPEVTIGESGCALPPEQHGFSSIELPRGPARARVRIEKDGAELAAKELVPVYREVSPNGPACGPTCRQASESISW